MMRLTAAAVISLAFFWLQPPAAPSGRGAQPAESARERAYRANNTGVAYLEQFNYQDAERLFREALALQPDLAVARVNLAIALLYAGRPADAAVEAGAASKVSPELPQAQYVLGLAAKAENRTDDAAAAFARVLKIDPADAATKVNLGQIHLQQREYAGAVRLFTEALTVEPYNVTAAYNLAIALTRAGRAEEGRAAMQRFEALRDAPYGVTYSQTYLGQGRYGEAVSSTGAEPDLVDQAVPDVSFSDATAAMLPAGRAAAGGRAATLFDADTDGDLDLVETDGRGLRFLRNQGTAFADETARAGLELARAGGWAGVVAGDYDNDGRPDLFLFGDGAHALLHQKPDGTFENLTDKAGMGAPAPGVTCAAFWDMDHDGDVDLAIAGASLRFLQNNGDGTFADVTAKAGVTGSVTARALVAADYDNRRDVDLLLAGAARPLLYRNMRDGTFRESAGDVGLVPATVDQSYGAGLAAADVNKDGYPDFLFTRPGAPAVLAASDGNARFTLTPAPAGTSGAAAAQFFDYDNDGLLDLLCVRDGRAYLWRNVGGGRWADVTQRIRLPQAQTAASGSGAHTIGVGDLDGDGDPDLVLHLGDGLLRIGRNDGGSRSPSLAVRLTARVSNRSAVGARVEMRAGSLRQALAMSASSPAAAPADLLFGLGSRASADVVRVLWPSGILQAETSPGPAAPAAGRRGAIVISELDRKPSSCPYLFTWNGARFEFVTDFMGGGEMGGWLAPSVWTDPDPDEYVRIRGSQLRPRDGRYELRFTNELEEALFFDRAQLLAVDHPAGVDVYPNEGLRSAPRPPFSLVPVRHARPPASARDEHGHDVLPLIAALDRRYPEDFDVLPLRGYAAPHELILDVGRAAEAPVLLLTGWTDYAFSSDNVAASQRRTAMQPPSLQVRDAAGKWQTVIEEIGFPVGRPQTVVVSLAGRFLSSSREVRIVTNMRIYWDEILVAAPADGARPVVTRLEPDAAHLRARGMSAEVTPDGREPFTYDYHRASAVVPWKVMAGRYTREGDVKPLLGAIDDFFVISRPGDEVALSFKALPGPAEGMARTFLLFVHGYSKEMNPRSAVPDTVAPLPFKAMSGYPYGAAEHYPRSSAHREYQERYNTRIVHRPVPSLDVAAVRR